MAKYVETLQRSNEQLVKVATLLSKKEQSDGLSKAELADIYEAISKDGDDKWAASVLFLTLLATRRRDS